MQVIELQSISANLPQEIKFSTKARRYRGIKVQFQSENAARKQSMTILYSGKQRLSPIYMGRNIVQIKFGAIHPDVRPA